MITQLGDTLGDVTDYPIEFARSNILAVWFVSFFAYDSLLDPVADRFAVVVRATIEVPEGDYLLTVESDDGIRIHVDGELVLDQWTIHTPEIDEVKPTLREGAHHIRGDYFEGGGLGVLDVSLQALP